MPNETHKAHAPDPHAAARRALIDILKPKYLHCQTIVPMGRDGLPMCHHDQLPITLSHAVIGALYALSPFQTSFEGGEAFTCSFLQGHEWEGLRAHRASHGCLGAISQDYPALWVRQIIMALERAEG